MRSFSCRDHSCYCTVNSNSDGGFDVVVWGLSDKQSSARSFTMSIVRKSNLSAAVTVVKTCVVRVKEAACEESTLIELNRLYWKARNSQLKQYGWGPSPRPGKSLSFVWDLEACAIIGAVTQTNKPEKYCTCRA